jgi:hypothetical protein
MLLIFDAEDHVDMAHTTISIQNQLQALSLDSQAVEFHTSDVAELTVTWPERARDSSI